MLKLYIYILGGDEMGFCKGVWERNGRGRRECEGVGMVYCGLCGGGVLRGVWMVVKAWVCGVGEIGGVW